MCSYLLLRSTGNSCSLTGLNNQRNRRIFCGVSDKKRGRTLTGAHVLPVITVKVLLNCLARRQFREVRPEASRFRKAFAALSQKAPTVSLSPLRSEKPLLRRGCERRRSGPTVPAFPVHFR